MHAWDWDAGRCAWYLYHALHLSPRSTKTLSFHAAEKGAVCRIQKGRKYLAPFVVQLTPVHSEAQSLASCNICQNTESKYFVTELPITLWGLKLLRGPVGAFKGMSRKNSGPLHSDAMCLAANGPFRAAKWTPHHWVYVQDVSENWGHVPQVTYHAGWSCLPTMCFITGSGCNLAFPLQLLLFILTWRMALIQNKWGAWLGGWCARNGS